MNEIANVLREISDKMGYTPTWISIIGIFVPILLSVLVLVMQILHQKSNKDLQKRIYNHEVDLKLFDSILDIYKVFSKSVDSLPQKEENIRDRLVDKNTKNNWVDYLIDVDRELYRKYDFAVLLLGRNDNLTKKLHEIIINYDNIIIMINKLKDNIKDEDINKLKEAIVQYMESMNYENFDGYFSKYINIKEFIEY